MNQIQTATQSTPTHTHRHAYANQRIAFIHACWNKDIVDQGRQSFKDELVNQGFDENQIDVFEVPGSLEIPLQAKIIGTNRPLFYYCRSGFNYRRRHLPT